MIQVTDKSRKIEIDEQEVDRFQKKIIKYFVLDENLERDSENIINSIVLLEHKNERSSVVEKLDEGTKKEKCRNPAQRVDCKSSYCVVLVPNKNWRQNINKRKNSQKC